MRLPGCLRRPPHLHLLPTWQSRQGALPRVPRRTGRPPHPASHMPVVLHGHPVSPMLVGLASRGPYGQDQRGAGHIPEHTSRTCRISSTRPTSTMWIARGCIPWWRTPPRPSPASSSSPRPNLQSAVGTMAPVKLGAKAGSDYISLTLILAAVSRADRRLFTNVWGKGFPNCCPARKPPHQCPISLTMALRKTGSIRLLSDPSSSFPTPSPAPHSAGT